MTQNKSAPTASRPFIFLLALSLIWSLGFASNASAQRLQSGTAAAVDAGTTVNVRTNEAIDTRDSDGQIFHGTVAEDVVGRSGRIVIPRGSDVEMTVREMNDNQLTLDLDSIMIRGERYGVQTESSSLSSADRKEGIGANKRTAEHVGGGALLGAIIGGIAGGGKGAAIGAGIGAAGGASVQVLTRGNHVEVPSESLLTFRLAQPLRAGYGGSQRFRTTAQANTTAAYRDGFQDGRSDSDQGIAWSPQDRRWTSSRDRRDYEAGYYDGFQAQDSYGVTREKPSDYGYERPSVHIGSDKNIAWQGPDDGRLFVQVDNNPVQLFASGRSGTQRAPWIERGHRYLFILRDAQGNEIARDQRTLR